MFEIVFALALLLGVWRWLEQQRQRERMALLGGLLKPYGLEALIQRIIDGYMRALGESDPQRQAQGWLAQQVAEQHLVQQFSAFAHAFGQTPAAQCHLLPWSGPGMQKLLGAWSADARRVMQVHAQGIERAVQAKSQQPSRDSAFVVLAELYLMQHTCHWFCRNKTIASARMLAQHKTLYAQALRSVSPRTREAYLAALRSGV